MFKFSKTLEEVESKHNGTIKVLSGTRGHKIYVDGVLQSGPLLGDIWDKALKKVRSVKGEVDSILILGLGGGTVARRVVKLYPEAKITGVDIDPKMVEVGKKYFQLNMLPRLKIVIADAQVYLNSVSPSFFDLVLIDLFRGEGIPERFYTREFVGNLWRVLKPKGMIAFNHFYGDEDADKAKKLAKTLREIFGGIVSVYPDANVVFLGKKI